MTKGKTGGQETRNSSSKLQDLLSPPIKDINWCHITEGLMVAAVVIVVDEVGNSLIHLAGSFIGFILLQYRQYPGSDVAHRGSHSLLMILSVIYHLPVVNPGELRVIRRAKPRVMTEGLRLIPVCRLTSERRSCFASRCA